MEGGGLKAVGSDVTQKLLACIGTQHTCRDSKRVEDHKSTQNGWWSNDQGVSYSKKWMGKHRLTTPPARHMYCRRSAVPTSGAQPNLSDLLHNQKCKTRVSAPLTIFQGAHRSENWIRLSIFRTSTMILQNYADNKQKLYKIMKMSAI
jgi:hypothetical protein